MPRAQDAAEKATDPALKGAMTGRAADLKRQLGFNNIRQQEQVEQVRNVEDRLREAKAEMQSLQSELDSLVKRLTP